MSRDAILAAIRAARLAPVERPDVPVRISGFVPPTDVVVSFIEAAEAASAHVVRGRRDDLATLLHAAYPARGRHVSAMSAPAIAEETALPHSFADTDVFVCEAALGVAENGAVWLPLSRLRHRAALFLTTNVIIVLDTSRIVGDLHRAYEAIDLSADGFGVFVAGPSKTADIEQMLVIGAHGAKSLTILLLDP
jgi:L-lactate dehydrogenase complex protein LldG